MLVMSIWGLLMARLTYSFVGMTAPELVYSALYIVLVSLTMVPVGAWIGALVYSLWPAETRMPSFRATPGVLLRVTALTLPLFYALWPLIKYWTLPQCGFFLFLTVVPCFATPVSRWISAMIHPKRKSLAPASHNRHTSLRR